MSKKFIFKCIFLIFEKFSLPKINSIKPDKKFGNFWTIFSLIFIIIIIIYVPLDIGFNIKDKNRSNFVNDTISNNFIYPIAAIIIILDMLINVNTAFYSRGVLQLKKSKIIKNYLKKQFILDLSFL